MTGEVWLCSGQSNMEMPMKGYPNQPVDDAIDCIVEADTSIPIRIFNVNRKTSLKPEYDCTSSWQTNNPETVAQTSAVAYFFAKKLYSTLKVPVGIIIASWGGTPIESWVNKNTLEKFPLYDLSFLDTGILPNRPHYCPTTLYNGMLSPIVGYGIKGFLWYQGEANSQWGPAYAEMQPLMTNDWRIRWKQGYLPFLYVQLAAFGTHSDTPQDYDYMAEFRDCQTKIMDMCQISYMACAIDAGEEQNIHPRRKDVVGERLYATYKENVLGGSAEGDSPRFKSVTRDGNRLIVTFDNAASGLVCKTPEQMNTCVAVCGEDKVWKWANAKIDGSSLIVEIPEEMAPVRIQYAWQGYPDAPLFNEEGFPVISFNEQINQ